MSARGRAFPWFKPHRVMADIKDPVVDAIFRSEAWLDHMLAGVTIRLSRYAFFSSDRWGDDRIHVVDRETKEIMAACTSIEAARAACRLLEGR